MTHVVRAKTASGDWCKPTAELPNGELAQLLHRTRQDSREQVVLLGDADRKAVPELSDPWFQDSAPIEIEPAVIVDRPRAEDPIPADPVVKVVFRAPWSGAGDGQPGTRTKPRETRPRMAIRRLTQTIAKLTAPRPVAYPNAPVSHTWVWPVLVAVVAAVAVAIAIIRPF